VNGTAPHYLAADLRRLSDMPSRRRLRSSFSDQLDVRQSKCSTVEDRAFAVAGARLWNMQSATWHRREWHTVQTIFIFTQSYPSCFVL